jgi:hypothetical protein
MENLVDFLFLNVASNVKNFIQYPKSAGIQEGLSAFGYVALLLWP